jgi:hypothetical protein
MPQGITIGASRQNHPILAVNLSAEPWPASPLALTDRGRIAPASRRSAGGAGVSTSAMGDCGDIQAKDPIDCGEQVFRDEQHLWPENCPNGKDQQSQHLRPPPPSFQARAPRRRLVNAKPFGSSPDQYLRPTNIPQGLQAARRRSAGARHYVSRPMRAELYKYRHH